MAAKRAEVQCPACLKNGSFMQRDKTCLSCFVPASGSESEQTGRTHFFPTFPSQRDTLTVCRHLVDWSNQGRLLRSEDALHGEYAARCRSLYGILTIRPEVVDKMDIFGRNETLTIYNADSSKNILTTCLKHICDPIR
jgi:hypothetical protein